MLQSMPGKYLCMLSLAFLGTVGTVGRYLCRWKGPPLVTLCGSHRRPSQRGRPAISSLFTCPVSCIRTPPHDYCSVAMLSNPMPCFFSNPQVWPAPPRMRSVSIPAGACNADIQMTFPPPLARRSNAKEKMSRG